MSDTQQQGAGLRGEEARQRYIGIIEGALRRAGRYSPGVNFQVQSLASVMVTLDKANADIAGLDSTVVWESTRYGQKMAPHPVFKIQRDAADSITRQMKALGLTVEDLANEDESDPLIELTQRVAEAGREAVVRPC